MLPVNNRQILLLRLLMMFAVIRADIEADSCDISSFTKRFQLFDHKKVNWITALMGCAKLNMTLASIANAAEQRQATVLVQARRRRKVNVWIGATSQHARNELVWLSSGQRLDAYEFRNWAIGEPDPSPNDCVFLFRRTAKWGTFHCNRVGHYMCEFLEAND